MENGRNLSFTFLLIILIMTLVSPDSIGHELPVSADRPPKRLCVQLESEVWLEGNAATTSQPPPPSTMFLFLDEQARGSVPFGSKASNAFIYNLLQQSVQYSRSDPADPIPSIMAYYYAMTIATIHTDPHGNISHCNLLEIKQPDRKDRILAQLTNNANRAVHKIDFPGILNVITACQFIEPSLTSTTSFKNSEFVEVNRPLPKMRTKLRAAISGIFPGTKWCGRGKIAKYYEDLGQKKDVDKCCRAHDHCPTKLRSFRSGYGLINRSLYTKSHCHCDSVFYDCLKRVGGSTAERIGKFFFNILRANCIHETPPHCLGQFRNNTCICWTRPTRDKLMVFRNADKQF